MFCGGPSATVVRIELLSVSGTSLLTDLFCSRVVPVLLIPFVRKLASHCRQIALKEVGLYSGFYFSYGYYVYCSVSSLVPSTDVIGLIHTKDTTQLCLQDDYLTSRTTLRHLGIQPRTLCLLQLPLLRATLAH